MQPTSYVLYAAVISGVFLIINGLITKSKSTPPPPTQTVMYNINHQGEHNVAGSGNASKTTKAAGIGSTRLVLGVGCLLIVAIYLITRSNGGPQSGLPNTIPPKAGASTQSSKPPVATDPRSTQYSSDLHGQLDQFFQDYHDGASDGGLTDPRVAERFFYFPLHWYGSKHVYTDAEDFVAPRIKAAAKAHTASKCHYSAGETLEIVSKGDPVIVKALIPWTSDSGNSGETLNLYTLRRKGGDEPFLIERVVEPGHQRRCA